MLLVQVSGHVVSAEGKKVLALDGAWNSHLDMARCDAEGDPLPDAHTTRLWNVRPPSSCMHGSSPSGWLRGSLLGDGSP